LNTAKEENFSRLGFLNLQDQIGAFLGGLEDYFEAGHNGLSITGRQLIAKKWRPEMIKIGNHMRRGKPTDMRAILENEIVGRIDGEEQGKFFRLCLETAKLDEYLDASVKLSYKYETAVAELDTYKKGHILHKFDSSIQGKGYGSKLLENIIYDADISKEPIYLQIMPRNENAERLKVYYRKYGFRPVKDEYANMYVRMPSKGNFDKYADLNLERLKDYKIALALEQDASASGAQIIALTTRNKQLAALSNVVPTHEKQRIYDVVASACFNDPRFIKINQRLGITEKDLRKGAKYQIMVSLYGAGERTGILQVEKNLAKALGKKEGTLVINTTDRDTVLGEISARIARYERWDPETTAELRALRENVKDIFNKGTSPGDEIMHQLNFLDSSTRELVDKLTRSYDRVVTPADFKDVALILSEYLAEEAPIIKLFSKYCGRLAADFLAYAKPSNSDFDWVSVLKTTIRGSKKKGYVLPGSVSTALGLKANEPVAEKFLKRLGIWKPGGTLDEIINGIDSPEYRKTGFKYSKFEIKSLALDLKKATFGKSKKMFSIEVFKANKLPKSWTNAPSVNFDGKIIEQNFTQSFEEKLVYKDKFGNWTTNVLQIPQKTELDWWDQAVNAKGKINDIADGVKARTAYGVNTNHSNDATLVKNFHRWGKANNIQTSSVHDAFVTNAQHMLKGREALREIMANTLESNIIKKTLDEMLSRGLPEDIYLKYLNEAIDTGLIPVPGRSIIGGKVLKISDILTKEDILKKLPTEFKDDYGFYGIG